jgi:hypothetical protein
MLTKRHSVLLVRVWVSKPCMSEVFRMRLPGYEPDLTFGSASLSRARLVAVKIEANQLPVDPHEGVLISLQVSLSKVMNGTV